MIAAVADLSFDPSLHSSFAIAPLLIAGIAGALAKGIGGLFKRKSANKQADAAAAEQFRSGTATKAQSEAQRIAQLKSLLANAGARGHQLQVDPSSLEARPYTGPDSREVVKAGRGSGLAGDIIGGVGGVAQSYVQSKELESLLGGGGVSDASLGGLDIDGAYAEAQKLGIPDSDVDDLIKELLADRGAAR